VCQAKGRVGIQSVLWNCELKICNNFKYHRYLVNLKHEVNGGKDMFLNKNHKEAALPVYEVQELSMDEALLVLAAEKELLESRQAVFASHSKIDSWQPAVRTIPRQLTH